MSFSLTWKRALRSTMMYGRDIAPRGQATKEMLQRTVEVNMLKPVLTMPKRKLSYKFMAAEAYWILSGDNRVETIAEHNKYISQFSDDGETFFGAYGPKVVDQLPYIVDKLTADPDTRQAGLTIWRENPPETKDVPCTISIFFNIRDGKVNCHVFMRSSDVWLGLPYDVFNFSMLACLVCARLKTQYKPGRLYLTAASSHLYERDFALARECIESEPLKQNAIPNMIYQDEDTLMEWLKQIRISKPGDAVRWWEI